jgi:hypothetical protein
MLQPTVQQAEALAAKTGAWSMVMGSDATFEGAQFAATQAIKHGYTPAVISQKEQWFVTTVGRYPNHEAAMSDTIAVRAKMRSSAFPVNVHSWCANPVDQGALSPVSPRKARQEGERAAEGTYAAPVAVPPRGGPPGADVHSRGAARDPALCTAHRARGTRDRVRFPGALENTTWKVIGCPCTFLSHGLHLQDSWCPCGA